MSVERLLPTTDGHDLIAKTRAVAAAHLSPQVERHEQEEVYPADVFAALAQAGLFGLPFSRAYGGGGQPYEVYLQVLEELAARWAAVALGISIHTVACLPLAVHGSDEQRNTWLPRMLAGRLIGGYSPPEHHLESEARRGCYAVKGNDGYTLTGIQRHLIHGGKASFHTLFARTGLDPKEFSCFLVPGADEQLYFGAPEPAAGLGTLPIVAAYWDGTLLETGRLIGREGQGLRIAADAIHSGRLGIAACATGLAQAALEASVHYTGQRTTSGRRTAGRLSLECLLSDMADAVHSARALYLDAARRRDAGLAFGRHASAAETAATTTALSVTTSATKVLGDASGGDMRPVGRYVREAAALRAIAGASQVRRFAGTRAFAAG